MSAAVVFVLGAASAAPAESASGVSSVSALGFVVAGVFCAVGLAGAMWFEAKLGRRPGTSPAPAHARPPRARRPVDAVAGSSPARPARPLRPGSPIHTG